MDRVSPCSRPTIHKILFALTTVLIGCSETPFRVSEKEVDLFPDGRELSADPSFTGVVDEILQRRGCSGHNCHGSPGGRASLVLTEDAAANYRALVGPRAASEPFLLVLPGVPDSSYLVIKLEGRQKVGLPMPLGSEPLDSIDLGNIRNWITSGATNR